MTRAAERPLRVLLDTHALLWWMLGDARLPRPAQTVIAAPSHRVFASAASVWEIATKVRLGRLPLPAEMAADLLAAIEAEGFETLAITAEHAQVAGRLEGSVRDPFDRMLVAQALSERLVFVSNERVFDAYGVTRVWGARR